MGIPDIIEEREEHVLADLAHRCLAKFECCYDIPHITFHPFDVACFDGDVCSTSIAMPRSAG